MHVKINLKKKLTPNIYLILLINWISITQIISRKIKTNTTYAKENWVIRVYKLSSLNCLTYSFFLDKNFSEIELLSCITTMDFQKKKKQYGCTLKKQRKTI